VDGWIDPEHDRLHAHLLASFDDVPELPVNLAPIDVRLDHLDIVATAYALRLSRYSLKAKANDFERDWRKRLAAPTSFYTRLEQLSGLRLQKVTGVLRQPQLSTTI
jgi:hypothetical protein